MSLDDDLRRWREAGLLDPETAARIAAFERSRSPKTGGPSLLEALVYVGLAVLAVGVVILAAVNWDELTTPARIATAGVPAVLALLAGFALRSAGSDELRRGGAAAWLLAAALSAVTVGIATGEADWNEENVALAVACTAFVLSLALWALGPSDAQSLSLVVSLGALAVAFGSRADDDPAVYAGLYMALFAVGAITLVEAGYLLPRTSSQVFAAVLLAIGALLAGIADGSPLWGEVLLFGAAAALVALGIARGAFAYMLFGVGVAFPGLISVIVRHVEDPTLVALALIVVGAALVGAVLLIARLRPWRRDHQPPAKALP